MCSHEISHWWIGRSGRSADLLSSQPVQSRLRVSPCTCRSCSKCPGHRQTLVPFHFLYNRENQCTVCFSWTWDIFEYLWNLRWKTRNIRNLHIQRNLIRSTPSWSKPRNRMDRTSAGLDTIMNTVIDDWCQWCALRSANICDLLWSLWDVWVVRSRFHAMSQGWRPPQNGSENIAMTVTSKPSAAMNPAHLRGILVCIDVHFHK